MAQASLDTPRSPGLKEIPLRAYLTCRAIAKLRSSEEDQLLEQRLGYIQLRTIRGRKHEPSKSRRKALWRTGIRSSDVAALRPGRGGRDSEINVTRNLNISSGEPRSRWIRKTRAISRSSNSESVRTSGPPIPTIRSMPMPDKGPRRRDRQYRSGHAVKGRRQSLVGARPAGL